VTNSWTLNLLVSRKHIDSGLNFLGENAAIGAIYNSLERQQLDAPKCHPKTRIAVIDRIIDWLKGILTMRLCYYGSTVLLELESRPLHIRSLKYARSMDVSWPPFSSGRLRRNVATLLDLFPPSPIKSLVQFQLHVHKLKLLWMQTQ